MSAWRPVRTAAILFVALLSVILAPGARASAAPLSEPACLEPVRGFVVASLCLRSPLVASGTSSRLTDLERAGIRLTEAVTTQGTLYLEQGIGRADGTGIAAAQERDIRALELDFARQFDPSPRVYVFAVPGTFELGMIVLFRMTPAVARSVAGGHAGALDVPSVSVALDWQVARLERPLTILRHELTHAMVHQIAGRDAELPAWLDEGLAAMSRDGLAAASDPDADLVITAALLSSARVSLARLSTTESWLRQSAALGTRSYDVARTATELLTKDVGRAGIVELLERTAKGDTFEVAFLAITGASVAQFESAFAGRVASAAPVARITTNGGPGLDGGLTWSARGFPPGAAATVAIDGGSYHLTYPVAIDQSGVFSAAFGSTAPTGTYSLRVTSGLVTASTSFWSGIATGAPTDVRPWGAIAR